MPEQIVRQSTPVVEPGNFTITIGGSAPLVRSEVLGGSQPAKIKLKVI